MAVTSGFLMTLLGTKVTAAPANVFVSHLEAIKRQLSPGLSMRLPAQVLLGGPADDEFIDHLTVRINPVPPLVGIMVELLSCEDDPQLCWIGDFSVVSANSRIAQREYRRYQQAARPITLSDTVRGYVLDGIPRSPSVTVSSVMWQQDGLFYAAEFATPERQNMLYMALSMANSEPIYGEY